MLKFIKEQASKHHSLPYRHGSPGIVVDKAQARVGLCRCVEYRPGKRLCFKKGIIGALSKEQMDLYCQSMEKLEAPGIQRRMASWMEAVKACKTGHYC